MDNYEVIVQKTVRDLFKGTPLSQIKKFKTTKENEIGKKDEELRNLILEKYPNLVSSISTLEQISDSLRDLQDVRLNFLENVKNIENRLIYSSEEYKHNLEFLNSDQEEVINEDLNKFNSLNECWEILDAEKDYKEILIRLSELKNIPTYNNFRETGDLLLSQLLEILMKRFVISNSGGPNSLENFMIGIFGVFHLINDTDKLNLSEFYIQLETEDALNEAFNILFHCINHEEKGNNFVNAWGETIKLVFKLFLLKLSMHIKSLSERSTQTNIIESIISTSSICKEFILLANQLTSDEENLFDDEFDSSIELYDDVKLPRDFKMMTVISELKLILNLNSSDLKIKVFTKETCAALIDKFLNFVKLEIQNNFLKSLNNPLDLICFWKNVFCKTNKLNYELIEQDCLEIFSEYENLFNFLFIEVAMIQIENSLKEEFEKINYNNVCSLTGNIKSIVKEIFIAIFDDEQIQNTLFVKKFVCLFENIIYNFLATNENYKSHYFTNSIASIFLDKNIIIYLKDFERCSEILKKLSDKFSSNLIESVKLYSLTLKETLITENYSDEDCYSDSRYTESLKNTCQWFKNNINKKNLELAQEDFSQVSIYVKCFQIIFKTYLTLIKELESERVSNMNIYDDLKLLMCVLKEFRTDENVNNLLAEAQIILPNEINDIDKDYWLYKEINYMFVDNETPSFVVKNKCREYDFYPNNVIDPVITKNIIPFPPRLNVFMLNTTKKNKATSSSGGNSSSKLLELRIDDNYLSLKPQNKVENQPRKTDERERKTPPMRESKDSRELDYLKDYLGYFGGKLKENLTTFTGYINNEKK